MKRTEETFRAFESYLGESGLILDVQPILLHHRTTLRDVYLHEHVSSAKVARVEIWWMLHRELGRSIYEIARLFHMTARPVSKRLQEVEEAALAAGAPLTRESARESARLIVARDTASLQAASTRNLAVARRARWR